MKPIVRLPRAEDDLDEIWLYIARDNVDAAYQTIARIAEATMRLHDHPFSGSPLEDTELRTIPVGSYTVYYRVTVKDVQILRVIHSARDTNKLDFD